MPYTIEEMRTWTQAQENQATRAAEFDDAQQLAYARQRAAGAIVTAPDDKGYVQVERAYFSGEGRYMEKVDTGYYDSRTGIYYETNDSGDVNLQPCNKGFVYTSEDGSKRYTNEMGNDWGFMESGFVTKDGMCTSGSEMQVRADIARAHARNDLADNPFPLVEAGTDGIGDVDPLHHYSDIDLNFSNRLQRVRSAAMLATGEHRAILLDVLKQYQQEGTPLNQQYTQMREASRDLRETTRAMSGMAYMSARDLLETERSNLRNSDAVKDCDKTLRMLEYMAGVGNVKHEADFEQVAQDVCNLSPAQSQSLTALHDSAYNFSPPNQNFNIEFKSLDNIVASNVINERGNWARKWNNIPKAELERAPTEGELESYGIHTVTPVIDRLFHQAESREGVHMDSTGINRGTCISVGGKPVCALMREHFDREGLGEYMDYNDWYKGHVNGMTTNFIMSGLMNNQRVEAFVPDEKGRIPEQPIHLSRSGYTPSPLKPVTMNAWESFFSKHGFYKEKLAQKQEYDSIVESRKAMQEINLDARMNERFSAGTNGSDIYVEPYFKANGRNRIPNPNMNVTRGAPGSYVAGQLAIAGMSISQIYDPSYKVEEKRALGMDYMSKAHEGMSADLRRKGDETLDAYHDRVKDNPNYQRMAENAKKAGECRFEGQQLLLASIEERLAGQDLTKLHLRPDFDELTAAAWDVFDTTQEKNRDPEIRAGYDEAASKTFATDKKLREQLRDNPAFQGYDFNNPRTPLNAQQKAACGELYNQRALAVGQMFNALYLEVEAQGIAARGETLDSNSAWTGIARAANMRESLAELNGTNKPISQQLDFNTMLTEYMDILSSPMATMDRTADMDALRHRITSGKVTDGFQGIHGQQNKGAFVAAKSAETCAEIPSRVPPQAAPQAAQPQAAPQAAQQQAAPPAPQQNTPPAQRPATPSPSGPRRH